MSIPTRAKLIERLGGPGGFDVVTTNEEIADFALAAVAEELDALRLAARAAVIATPLALAGFDAGRERERTEWSVRLDARLAALLASQSEAAQPPEGAMRVEQAEQPPGAATKVGEYAGIPIMADPSVKPGTIEGRAASSPCPPPAVPTAAEDAYDGIEGFVSDLGCTVRECIGCGCLTPGGPTRCKRCTRELDGMTLADVRRLDAAPEPEVDVFEAFGCATSNKWSVDEEVALVRDWFGPLVEAAEFALSKLSPYSFEACSLRNALSALRRRATEAST